MVKCRRRILSKLSLPLYRVTSILIILHSSFRALLKMILSLIESNNSVIVIAALQTLSKIIRSTEMQASWSNFLELIVLKYIDNYKTSKEVCNFCNFSGSFRRQLYYKLNFRSNVRLI